MGKEKTQLFFSPIWNCVAQLPYFGCMRELLSGCYVEIKCQLDATDDIYCRFYCMLNMFRGNTMPIIRSSRVLYRWSLPVVFGALVFRLSVCCGAGSYVSGLQAAALVLPVTCWACNKICNKYHLLHLVGILFPRNNDDARSKSLQSFYLLLTMITSELLELGLWNMQWVYVRKHACKVCVKYCLYVLTNMATEQKFEVISDKNSVGRCRIIYFNSPSFPKVAYLQL